MKISRRYIRVATVLTIAATTGHIMQNGDAIAARLGVGDQEEVSGSLAEPPLGPMTDLAALGAPRIDVAPGLSYIPGRSELRPVFPTPDRLETPGQLQVAALETAQEATPLAPETRTDIAPAQPMAIADCAPDLVAEPRAAAMIRLSMTAPCNPNAEVRIAHGGIAFKIMTDADGAFSLEVPALESPARFAVTLAEGAEVSTRIEMPVLEAYDRVAVTWSGSGSLELHAFEFGADYGQDGHVWRGNPKEAGLAIAGRGGFSTLLGDAGVTAPVLTEVYTFPAGRTTRSGMVRLSLEAEVTATNCGQDINSRAVTVIGGKAPTPVEVTLAVPDCEAIGDFLVLNTLFDDLRVAAK